MGSTDVIQSLQALDVPSLGLTPGEKKAKLRGEVGLAKEDAGGGAKEVDNNDEKRKTPSPADKARTNTENAKKAAEVRRKVLEAKQKKAEAEAEKGGGEGGKK